MCAIKSFFGFPPILIVEELFTVPSSNQEFIKGIPLHHIKEEQQDRRVDTGIPQIDSFLEGFNSSTLTLIESNHSFSFEILSILCVRAVKLYGDGVVYVDGGNSIEPYTIASLSMRAGLKADDVLSKIMAARAFTAYQLDSIISDRLEEVVRRENPVLLIISCITDLLTDRSIRKKEAVTILRRSLSHIKKISHEHNLITIITKKVHPSTARALSLDDLLYEEAQEIIQLKRKRKEIEIQSINRGLIMHYEPPPILQTTLDDFIGDDWRC
jgi:predicted ATP-dependent serine protease